MLPPPFLSSAPHNLAHLFYSQVEVQGQLHGYVICAVPPASTLRRAPHLV